jgi:oxygen-independent coproporphyrinogen-3 oxidase
MESHADVSSLYAHVPFCAKKCAYCAFYSEASDGETMNRYTACLVKEIQKLPENFRPVTIFFGGGTPSLLTLPQWTRILETLQGKHLLGRCEFTIECNPATVSLDKARLLRSFGVNRISMGVQSLDEALLDRLGRVHSRDMVFRSYDILRKAGFSNVNLDLMFAIPGQTMAVWEETLREVLAMGSEHISTYEVIYEDDTPLFLELQKGHVREDEELACAMYETLVERVTAAGFRQYEIANFAREQAADSSADEYPSYACRHNLNYWRGGQFYGVGPSATSYVGGIRTRNLANTRLYCEAIEQNRSPAESSEQLPPLRRAGETAAFGLRMTHGWTFDLFRKVTGFDLRREWLNEMRELEGRGLAVIEEDRFRLNSKGLRFADMAAEMFLR